MKLKYKTIFDTQTGQSHLHVTKPPPVPHEQRAPLSQARSVSVQTQPAS